MYDEDLKCREANLTFWNVGFPLIFGTFLFDFSTVLELSDNCWQERARDEEFFKFSRK